MRRLVIRPGAIGDCILAMPAIRHLACEYLEIWLPSSVCLLLRALGNKVVSLATTGLDTTAVGDLGMSGPLKRKLQSFDSIVSWYGANREEFRETMLGTGVPCQFHSALPPSGYGGHATDFFLDQVGGVKGAVPRLDVRPRADRSAVVIHPFSGSKKKNWPLQRYHEVAERLSCDVEWSAGPEEELPEAMRFSDLYDLAEWIRGAQLYIGNDSGITHLAAVTGVPTLALFGPTDPNVWAPRGENVTVLRAEPLELLDADTVRASASRLLRSR